MEQNNPAKFAFYYLLSLVALIFMALSTGMIIFQIINKSIPDILLQYNGSYSPEALKFAISALVISAPIFYVTMSQICKSLFTGALDKDSGIRKWLSYLVLFISSVVMIGWLIATINGFLNGDLTLKFFLKALTALVIAAAVFSYYFYDIRRGEVKEKKDRVISIYFYASLAIVVAAFVSSLFFVESPAQTRNRKIDEMVIANFDNISNAITAYYQENKQLPTSLSGLKVKYNYITDAELKNPTTGEDFVYAVKSEKDYELCTMFLAANLDSASRDMSYLAKNWPHDKGWQCIPSHVIVNLPIDEMPIK